MMVELPKELTIEIFLLLPVESLIRCKFVCKTWLNLITSPSFVSMHLNDTKTCNPSILLKRTGHEDNFGVFSFHAKEKSLRKLPLNLEIPSGDLLGTRNGVLLIKGRWQLFLYNPATKEVKRIYWRLAEKTIRWGDTFVSSYKEAVGLGYASSNILDLKVVIIYELSDLRFRSGDIYSWSRSPLKGLRADLFSFSSNECTSLDWCLERVQIFPFSCLDTFVEYSCHWYAERCNSWGKPEERFILCFNMNTDSFKTMGIAKDCLESLATKSFSLGVVKESLSLIYYTSRNYGMLGIWVMKEYGVAESWTKLFEVEPLFGVGHPYPLWMNDEALILEQGRELIMCKLDTHETDPISGVIGGSKPTFLRSMQAWLYNESVLSIK